MSFFLYLVYLCVTFLRIDVLFPEMAANRPMLWLMVICLVTSVVSFTMDRKISAEPRHFLLLAALVLIVAASQVVNGWAGGAVQAVSDFLPSAAIAVLTWLNVTSIRRLKIASGVVVTSLLVLSVAGILSFDTGFMQEQFILRQSGGEESASMPIDPDADEEDEGPGTFLRLKGIGFLADPNDFAQAIVLALPMLWGFYRRRHAFHAFFMVMVPTLLFSYAIFLTHSRGALVGLLAMLVFGIRKRLGNIKTALIAGVLVLGVQVSNFSGGREISTQETSAGDRIESWNIGIHLLASHPLLGIGYGNYTNFNVLTAHNSYVLCFTELGLLGFFVWMALIVLGYQATNSVANTAAADTAQKIWGTSLRAALIGFLACAWFLSRTYQPLLYILLALCIAVRYPDHAALPVAPKGPVEVTVPWAKPTVVVCLVAIMAAYATIIMQRVTGH